MAQRRVGNCVNLSATGVLFEAEEALAPGDAVKIELVPKLTLSPPLIAMVKILRVEPRRVGGGFRLAGTIERVLN